MKLTAVHVREFRCVRDCGEFTVDDVTCLVGKNESGKTSVLQALYRLNPVVEEDASFNVTHDYPRVDVSDYEQEVEDGLRNNATPITATFEVESDEIETIEAEFGKGVLPKNRVELSRHYSATKRTVSFLVDEASATKHLVAAAPLTEEVQSLLAGISSIAALEAALLDDSNSRKKAVATASAAANAIPDPTEKAKALQDARALGESEAARELRELTEAIAAADGLRLYIWGAYLRPSLPLFLYFDEYYQMTGEVNIEALQSRNSANTLEPSDRPMLGLIEMARLNLNTLLTTSSTEDLVNKLEGASNRLTSKVLQYWSQNKHLQVKFAVHPAKPSDPVGMQSGTNLWGRVYDSLHSVTTRLGSRSKGFVWFFSFLAWFSKQKNRKQPLILLLDEPGLFLHAKAQADLLRYIDVELKPHHQVIYTTHSPFMVDASNFDRVRIVEDRSTMADGSLNVDEQGTKVFTEVLEADDASLFPLQGALGFDIAQSLFVGPNCLIVEGVSDLLYIQVMTSLLQSEGRIGLDSRWTITPVGGSDKVATFCALLGAQEMLNIATLIDRANKDAQKIEKLYTSKLMSKKQVLTYADFTGQQEADVEDMFELGVYLSFVNGEYASFLPKKLTQAALKSQRPRMTQHFEDYFEANPLTEGQRYNHYRPARYLAEKSGALQKAITKSAKTMDRFEEAFRRLNALLN